MSHIHVRLERGNTSPGVLDYILSPALSYSWCEQGIFWVLAAKALLAPAQVVLALLMAGLVQIHDMDLLVPPVSSQRICGLQFAPGDTGTRRRCYPGGRRMDAYSTCYTRSSAPHPASLTAPPSCHALCAHALGHIRRQCGEEGHDKGFSTHGSRNGRHPARAPDEHSPINLTQKFDCGGGHSGIGSYLTCAVQRCRIWYPGHY